MMFATILKIDLTKIALNYQKLSRLLGKNECGAVVKADAYGVGLKPVVETLTENGCRSFFVATLDEALTFRSWSKDFNLYMLHGVKNNEEAFISYQHNIIPVLNSEKQVRVWSSFCSYKSLKLKAILHLETGLGRLGIQKSELIKIMPDINNINVTHIMSHLACADEPEHSLNQIQLSNLKYYIPIFPNAKVSLANSAGIFLGNDFHFDLARPGCSLYGINPCKAAYGELHFALSIYAVVLQKKILEIHQSVGYGAEHQAKRGDKILIIEVGYADGYFRSLKNHGYGFFAGKKLPIIGRISMDMIALDANSLTEVEFANVSQVEMMGENISLEYLASSAKTISYEVLTALSKRYKRIYIK